MRTFNAAWRYEFRMQAGKPSLWIAMLALGLLFLTLPIGAAPTGRLGSDIATAAVKLNWLGPMLLGGLAADRLVRDRRLHVAELLDATGATPGARLWGKYAGTVCACLLPLSLVWLVTLARFILVRHQPQALPLGVAAFAAILLPAVLLVTAFALVSPAVLGAPLFRVLLVGYWLWGNLLSPGYLPTLSGTPLSPIGDYARAGLFGGANPYGGSGIGAPDGTGPVPALFSITALVGLGLTCLVLFQAVIAGRTSTR